MTARKLLITASIFGIVVFIAGCGIKGPPLPPDPETIPPIKDLTATLVGSIVHLSWTPSFRYSDGSELQLRGAAIYRLDEELSERLLRQDEELRKQKERIAGGESATTQVEPPLGELNLRVQRITRLPVADFRKKAKLVAELRVEQLLDRAAAGRIQWAEPLALEATGLPAERSVYAVTEIDARGRRSAFAKMVTVIPLPSPPKPDGVTHSLTQEQLTLSWSYPDRSDEDSRQLALVGFNVWKTPEGEIPSPAPVNTIPIETAPPSAWTAVNIISHQQITGSRSRYAYLFTTDATPDAAGVSQTIIPSDKIDEYRGRAVNVELRLSSPGGAIRGLIVLDSSRDPAKPDEEPAGAEVFSEEENPLIARTEILIDTEPKTFSLDVRIAADARALVLRIEPRGSEPVSASFILESARAEVSGETGNLLKNGDFDGFASTSYIEPMERFGETYSYRVSAVYSISGLVVESEPSEVLTVKLEDTFPPDGPKNPRALPTADAIILTWDASRATDLRGYVVFRREGPEGAWRRLTEQPLSGTFHRDTEVSPDIEYAYRIQAVDRAGNRSLFTSEVSARLTP